MEIVNAVKSPHMGCAGALPGGRCVFNFKLHSSSRPTSMSQIMPHKALKILDSMQYSMQWLSNFSFFIIAHFRCRYLALFGLMSHFVIAHIKVHIFNFSKITTIFYCVDPKKVFASIFKISFFCEVLLFFPFITFFQKDHVLFVLLYPVFTVQIYSRVQCVEYSR